MKAYLDHNAAAPLRASAKRAMTDAMATAGNPSSVHGAGRSARRIVEDARAAIARSVGAAPADVVFAGSGTEACALMLRQTDRPRRIVAATEHVAVLAAAPEAAVCPVDRDGCLDLAALMALLGDDASDAVVAVMLANNETGVIQPIVDIAAIVHAAGGLLAVDAAQAYGKLPLDMAALGADALALSAAKIGGPLGVGAAVFRPGALPSPLLTGGGQERGLRAGTENVVGIAGFGAAAADIPEMLHGQAELAALRDRMETAIRAVAPAAVVVGADAPRLANTSALAMPGVAAMTQVMAFDLAGYAVSAGAACSSGKVERSHVLAAMGLAEDIVASAVRVSIGPGVTAADIDGFVQAWTALYSRQVAFKDGAAGEPARP